MIRERGEGNDGTEGAHHREGRKQHTRERGLPPLIEEEHQKEHPEGIELNDQIGERALRTLKAAQLFLKARKPFGSLLHFRELRFSPVELQELVHAVEALQDKVIEFSHLASKGHTGFGAPPAVSNRKAYADRHVREDGKNAGEPVLCPDKAHHDERGQNGNRNRRYGVRKEHFQKFDIARDDGNQVALIPALKL